MTIVPFREASDYAHRAGAVAAHLRRGGLIAYPTETVYGLGSALLGPALERLAALKGRERLKPFLLLVADQAHVKGLEWTAAAQRLAAAFWPGPLTLVLRATRAFPRRVLGQRGSVALRATPHDGVRAILTVLGEPITSTSANLPGEPPATDLEQLVHVVRAMGEPGDLWVLDGGDLGSSPPSTIVDCTVSPPRVLRHGAIAFEALRGTVDEIDG